MCQPLVQRFLNFGRKCPTLNGMTSVPPNPLPHPDREEIELPVVLAALGDPTRLAIVGYLGRDEDRGMICGQFTHLAGKTAITYHVAKLREAGVVNVKPEGTKRRITLRRADLDALFPGLLDSILATARALPLEHIEENAA